MQEILEVSCRPVHDGIWTPAELMGALERAATDHADALNIGHDRMVADFGSLWMLVRSRLELTRLPAADEALTVRTWLRSPTPVMSVRDYDFCADGEVIGSAAFHIRQSDPCSVRPSGNRISYRLRQLHSGS